MQRRGGVLKRGEKDMTLKIKYREVHPITRCTRVDIVKDAIIRECFWSGELLYGKLDRYNYLTVGRDDIIEMQEL